MSLRGANSANCGNQANSGEWFNHRIFILTCGNDGAQVNHCARRCGSIQESVGAQGRTTAPTPSTYARSSNGTKAAIAAPAPQISASRNVGFAGTRDAILIVLRDRAPGTPALRKRDRCLPRSARLKTLNASRLSSPLNRSLKGITRCKPHVGVVIRIAADKYCGPRFQRDRRRDKCRRSRQSRPEWCKPSGLCSVLSTENLKSRAATFQCAGVSVRNARVKRWRMSLSPRARSNPVPQIILRRVARAARRLQDRSTSNTCNSPGC